MRILVTSKRGAARSGTVLLVGLLLAGVGLAVFLARRSPSTGTSTKPAAVLEVARTNLVLEGGRLHERGTTNAFNGLMVEHYIEGALRSRSAVTNGLLNGLSQGFYTNGQMQVSEHFKDGVSDGLRTKWYPDGAKQSEADIVEGKLQGTFRKWHTNGVMSEMAQFAADKPEGTSTAWFPSGYLKARVTLKDGKPVEQTFWKDGEKKE